jgi:Cu/Ag efflux protein CusF
MKSLLQSISGKKFSVTIEVVKMAGTARLFAACLLLFVALVGCGRTVDTASKTPPKEYQMRGEVRALDAAGHVATIQHGPIPGLMNAMTMGYPVKDPAEFKQLHVGDQITATVYVRDDDMWVGNIKPAP